MEIMQSKFMFPARIAPFSVPEPLPSPEKKKGEKTEKGAIRAGNVDLLYIATISITEDVKFNDLQKSSDRTPLRAYQS